MSRLRAFEMDVLRLPCSGRITPDLLDTAIQYDGPMRYERSGSGYYLSFSPSGVPQNRIVCDQPRVIGQSGDVTCGFIVFIDDGELTLECHTWGPIDVPEGFRDRDVDIRTV